MAKQGEAKRTASTTDSVTDQPGRVVLQRLRQVTAMAWISGIGTLGVLWGQYWLGWLPPAVLPFLAGIALLCMSMLAALMLGAWRVLVGPSRIRSLLWSVLATLPLLLLAAPGEYARRQWQQKQVPANFLMRTATLLAATIMRAEALFKYPNREETEHLVMLYDRLERPRADAQMMERHVARMEAMLGRRLPSKVVWVRGSLLGEDNLSIHGLALGSWRSPDDWSTEIDQHELAHAALDLLRSPWADPPMCLHEGWAELNGGVNDAQLAALAYAAVVARQNGEWIRLKELVGPEWYHQDSGPVYWEGHLFVEFVVRRYGVQRFYELYNTCRPETFDDDCTRILGVDLDALEDEFWGDVKARLVEMKGKAEQ